MGRAASSSKYSSAESRASGNGNLRLGAYNGCLRTQKPWPEALATIEEIRRTYPRLCDYLQRDVDWWRNHIREQLAEKDVKRPAAGTSNKEDEKKEP